MELSIFDHLLNYFDAGIAIHLTHSVTCSVIILSFAILLQQICCFSQLEHVWWALSLIDLYGCSRILALTYWLFKMFIIYIIIYIIYMMEGGVWGEGPGTESAE